jgi:hypothetical protein
MSFINKGREAFAFGMKVSSAKADMSKSFFFVGFS